MYKFTNEIDSKIRQEIKSELERMVSFWDSLVDRQNGGFYGEVGHDLVVNKNADKGAILYARILWFYANVGKLEQAKICYDFLTKYMIDHDSGGMYWSVKADGTPANTMKHCYTAAFGIYGLVSYYEASGDKTALEQAFSLFETVETRMLDKNGIGYKEAFNKDWTLRNNNDELSENGIQAEKTMNATLHLIESYTQLYKVSQNEKVLERLEYLLQLAYDKLYDKEKSRLSVFFDNDMNTIGDVYSYGHDIEAAWLIGYALDVVGDKISAELCRNIRNMNKVLVDAVEKVSFDENGAMFYESVNGVVNKNRAWWTQSEAFAGFMDAYRLYGDEKYRNRANAVWEYIKAHIIDNRKGGEWLGELDENENPVVMPVVGEWKCPYHNGRMCLMAV